MQALTLLQKFFTFGKGLVDKVLTTAYNIFSVIQDTILYLFNFI